MFSQTVPVKVVVRRRRFIEILNIIWGREEHERNHGKTIPVKLTG